MNNSKLKNLAWVVFVLIVSTYSVVAQGRKTEMSAIPGSSNLSLADNISGLSTAQQDQIRQLENGYNLVMGELRTKAQVATDVSEKSALRDEMQQITQSHQNNVKRMLTKDQKKEYNKLLAENTNTVNPQGKGKGQGQGKSSGGMRGNGQGRRY